MSNETQQKQGLVIHHPPGWRPSDDELESWQRTHAQLLKSVADAQAKLLAAQNEICDKVESISRNLGLAEKRLTDRLEVLGQRLTTLTVSLTVSAAALNGNHSGLKGQLDAIGAVLAELLTVRRPVARAAKRRRKR